MTTAMAAHQDSPHERLQVPTEDPEHYIRRQTAAWPLQGSLADNDIVDQSQNEHIQNTRPFYRTPKRNKRKNFKPRCAPNAAVFSDDSNNGDSMGMAYDEPASPNEDVGENRYSPDQLFEEREVMPVNHGKIMKIGVKNFSLLKGPSAVDLTRRFSTDSNENIDHSAPNEEVEGAPRKSDSRFQQSYIQSLRDKTGGVKMTECQTKDMLQPPYTTIASTKSYSAKYPFAISQLIKTNSPPRRRTSVYSEEGERDTNADETGDVQEGEEDLNGDQNTNVTNRMLQEYAANTMTELLGIYGLSSTEFADTITGQMRTLEALQGRSSGTKRRMPWSSAEQPRDRRARRSSSVTTEDDAASPPPASTSPHRHPARHYSSQESLGAPYSRRGSALGSCDADSGASTDGDHTLDLSVSKDGDAQDLSTTSSTGNSVSDYDQHTLLMRKNLEDMANLQMQGFFPKPPSLLEAEDGSSQDTRKLHHSGLLSALNQLDTARKSTSQSAIDYSRYVKRYSSSLECGSSYCKDLGYREHFHCMDCTARVFCKKEEMIRHFKWHKKRDESLAHGFMRYSPLDDCGDRYSDCPHNRSQTHYHCIQDGCDKVYISTSDVQMHANYHRKDSAILQEGFQRFRATETCSAIHCAFQGQRTTHFHCRRPGCTFTFKNKADMEKHKTYHIKDEQLARDGFKKYMKNEPCPYSECRFSRTCNHIHCIRPRCNYVLHSSSQLFSHKRKHERKDHEMGFGLASTVMQSAFLQQQGGVEGTLKRSSSPGSNGLFPSEVEENSLSSLHAYAASAQDLQTDALLPHSNLNQMVLEDIFVKYVETFAGGREPEDKCRKCSAFNKHYHCVANNCKMAHSCQNTMMKHALEHEQQKQVTEAFFITYNKNNPCSGSACNHIRDIAHYHCNWENCGAVILASDDEPLKRLEHHRQHAILSPLSPSVMSRLGPNLASQMSAQLHPNIAAQLGQTMAAMPHTFAPTLQAHLAISQHGGQPVNHPVSQSSSLDEMFSRKRGRPPKNRVVEVWTDNVTPQAIFTSFKLPKSSQPPLVHSPSISTIDDISLQRIKFDNFEVYTAGEACSYSHPHCPIQLSKLHLHCCHCNYAGESHILLEAHARESHAIGILLEGYQYYNSHEQCKVVQCCKNQLRSHFHCIQVPSCRMVVNQYSALAAHKHDPKVADMEMQEMKVEEAKDYSVVREVKSETKHEEVATNFSMKTEVLDKDSPDTSLSPASVSVVKATGTFYPSSHLNKNLAPSPSHQPDGSPRTESRDVKPNFTPTIPPSCHDNHCVLNKKTGHSALNLHYHCPHCSQPYVDLKLLYGHMVKKHSMDSGALGLAATKETLEREYPEISILPSTASASTSPTVRQQNPAEQVHAVQSLLLQQYLSASTAQQQSVKKTSLQEQLKFQQQYNASLATSLTPSHLAHIAFLTQGGSPFPLYPSMLYPPELILEQSLLAGPGQSAPDKEAEAIIKKTHTRTGPHMRVLKDEPIPEGYLRFRFNEDCEYPHCGYREHQTHFHCTRKDCGYSFCDKTRFVQHTARHERLDTLMGGDFQQYRANVYCNRQDCLHASNFGSGQNKASHFHCLKCDFVCTDTNKVVAHRRQHQKMDSIQAAGFEKYPPSKGCGYEPQCIHSRKQTHYHCLQCGFAVLGLSQMTSHKYRHQEANQGAGTSRIS